MLPAPGFLDTHLRYAAWRAVLRDEDAAKALKKRTLTNLLLHHNGNYR